MRTVTPPCHPPLWPPWPSPTRRACDHWIRPLHRAGCPHSRRRREEGGREGGSGSISSTLCPQGHLPRRPVLRFQSSWPTICETRSNTLTVQPPDTHFRGFLEFSFRNNSSLRNSSLPSATFPLQLPHGQES